MEERKKMFEEWLIRQMGKCVKPSIGPDSFHHEDGYHDQTVNAMWIGFNAGVELGPLVD